MSTHLQTSPLGVPFSSGSVKFLKVTLNLCHGRVPLLNVRFEKLDSFEQLIVADQRRKISVMTWMNSRCMLRSETYLACMASNSDCKV
jgi:hypothetical protein